MVYECFIKFKRGMGNTTIVKCVIQNGNAAIVGLWDGF